jgi:4-diphosphocytidyl-2-C-methyl-D-erythritol kinase
VIGEVLAALSGAALARMSGSGATCFGLFETQADAKKAADELAAAHADWWVMPCTLGGSS